MTTLDAMNYAALIAATKPRDRRTEAAARRIADAQATEALRRTLSPVKAQPDPQPAKAQPDPVRPVVEGRPLRSVAWLYGVRD